MFSKSLVLRVAMLKPLASAMAAGFEHHFWERQLCRSAWAFYRSLQKVRVNARLLISSKKLTVFAFYPF